MPLGAVLLPVLYGALLVYYEGPACWYLLLCGPAFTRSSLTRTKEYSRLANVASTLGVQGKLHSIKGSHVTLHGILSTLSK